MEKKMKAAHLPDENENCLVKNSRHFISVCSRVKRQKHEKNG